MRFTINTTILKNELESVAAITDKKSTIPILSNVLIEADKIGQRLTLKATNLDLSLSADCSAGVADGGAICVPARKLTEIVKALPDAEIDFTVKDDNVTIKCGASRFKLSGRPATDFPELPDALYLDYVSLPSDLLSRFIARTRFAITQEESRYALNGALFEAGENRIRLVATDGHRLAFTEKEIETTLTTSVLIPRDALAQVGRLLDRETIEVAVAENHIHFRSGSRLFSSRRLTGQFPDYRLVLPKGNANRFQINAPQLARALSRVALMADERSHAVKFVVAPGELVLSGQSAETGEALESLTIEYTGPNIEAGFNAAYLLDFLAALKDGDCVIELKDGNSQTEFKPVETTGEFYRYVVMPMRL